MIECIPRRCRFKQQHRDCSREDWGPTENGNHASFCNYFWKDHDKYVVAEPKNEMQCSSCKDKKTPADCLLSPHFSSMTFNLGLEELYFGSMYSTNYYFRRKHKKAQLSCLADCFLMDGNWCNTRLPDPHRVKSDKDYSGESYDDFAQPLVS